MSAITFDVSPLCHARAEHFQQCAEFPLLRNHGLGPRRVGSQRLGRSSVVSRNYNKFWPRGLNPLLSTTAFFVCCGMRRQFSICADVTLRRFDIPHREWAMWHVEHSTGKFRLCRNRVAVAAQSQSLIHARRLAEMLNAEEIGRGGHEGDQ